MTTAELLRHELLAVEFNDDFSEAVLLLSDQCRLCFCHRVGERWAKAIGPHGNEKEGGVASQIIADVKQFRLNRKHLDIEFEDRSRFDERLQNLRPPDGSH